MSLKNLLSMMNGRRKELKAQLRLVEAIIAMVTEGTACKDPKVLICALCLLRHDIVDGSCQTTSECDPQKAYDYIIGIVHKSVKLLSKPEDLDYGRTKVDSEGGYGRHGAII